MSSSLYIYLQYINLAGRLLCSKRWTVDHVLACSLVNSVELGRFAPNLVYSVVFGTCLHAF